jgi:hypothetical protein
MVIKGYTVHLKTGDRTACGVKPRLFLGKPAVSSNLRRVTCQQCERAARATTVQK